ncbi:MAG: response regulator transcription factor [Lachnospiraceae bacterium]|nr:response regulator transcription factor [Lachnospiraceae bacterium]
METEKILIIEDDEGLNRGISFALGQEGYEVTSARTLQEGNVLYRKENPDAVILDLNLPDGDGIEFCKKIRQRSNENILGGKDGTAILMLTARDMETDEIMGLTSGADDYMVKPFSVSVLKIRLRNILSRKKVNADPKSAGGADSMIISGDVILDCKTFRASQGGRELDLSITEFRLLQYLMENKNQALLKEQILQRVWDADRNYVEENTLSVNISRLRKKLGGNYICTIQGIGYLWKDDDTCHTEKRLGTEERA